MAHWEPILIAAVSRDSLPAFSRQPS